MNNWKSFPGKLAAIAIIACLGIIVYSNTFFASFILDDHSSIINNASIKNIKDLQGIWNFWPSRFLTYLSFALNYHFHQLDVFGYHFFNLLVHLVAGILVWWLILMTLSTPAMKQDKITKETHLIALLAGLVFISHPVQTEAVTYIVQRAASMASLFYLASLCFFVKSRLLQIGKTNSNHARFYYSCALVMAVMAMFAKEMAITLPLMILLYEFSFLSRKKELHWKPLIPFLLTVLIIPLAVTLTKSVDLQEMHRIGEDATNITPLQYLFTEFRVIITYIRLLVVPLNQNLDYDYHISHSFFELPTFISFLFLISILFLAKRLFLKYRLISFSILWFFLVLLPESSLLPIKDVIFEHRLYLPMVGYSILLVSSMYYFFGKKTMLIILLVIIACNSVLTYQRNQIWHDGLTMWNDVILKSPSKSRGYNSRGECYIQLGRFTQALSDFNRAIELNPANVSAYLNRGLVYSEMGNLFQAIMDDNKAIEINPKYAIIYNNRGNVFFEQGNLTQAIADYNKAIEINPEFAEAYKNRGNFFFKQGNLMQAIADYTKAIEINPEYAESYFNLGLVYYNQNNFAEAMIDFNKAIKINPKFADVYNNRGNVFFEQGNLMQAIADYTKAIEINPTFARAYQNRAISFYLLKKYDQSWADVNKAQELGSPVQPELIKSLNQASGRNQR